MGIRKTANYSTHPKYIPAKVDELVALGHTVIAIEFAPPLTISIVYEDNNLMLKEDGGFLLKEDGSKIIL